MISYDGLQVDAKQLIQEFGVFGYAKLVRGAATLDPVSGMMSGGGQEIPLTAVDLSINKSLVNGDSIKSTDRMVIMSSDVKPLASDSVLIGSETFKIMEIMPLSPGGVDVYYKVICRG